MRVETRGTGDVFQKGSASPSPSTAAGDKATPPTRGHSQQDVSEISVAPRSAQATTSNDAWLDSLRGAASVREAIGGLRAGLTSLLGEGQSKEIFLAAVGGGSEKANHWITAHKESGTVELRHRVEHFRWVEEHLNNPFMSGMRHSHVTDTTLGGRFSFPFVQVTDAAFERRNPWLDVPRLARMTEKAFAADAAKVDHGLRPQPLTSAGAECRNWTPT